MDIYADLSVYYNKLVQANKRDGHMDLNRQIETMKNLLSSENEADNCCQTFCVGRESYIDAVQLWNGIILWANDIHLTKLAYPMHVRHTDDHLLLNICHAGRCEVELMQGSYVYMSPGVLSVNTSPPKNTYYYPGGIYGGIEICFNMRMLRDKMPDALTSYGFNYSTLERYAAKGNLLAALTGTGMQEEEALFNMIRGKKASLPALRFAALSLIYHLTNGESTEIDGCAPVSKGQRRIVTEAEQMLTADLKTRYTMAEIASRFGISSSALKKYFAAVYGRTVSRYMREKRMEKAAALLVETDESVGVIASACGYEHQGKFGMAFKDFTGISPLEYRRLRRKPTQVI